MAKAKKLPSGQWRTLVYSYTTEDGKRKYESFTAPTKKESEYLAAEFSMNKKSKRNSSNGMTLKEAMDKYYDIKSAVLSPTTLRAYGLLKKNAYSSIEDLKITDIDKQVVQRWINSYAKDHAAKTVSNANGFLTAVLYYFVDGISLRTTVPSKVRYDAYVPNDREVEELMRYYAEHDKDMLIASCLAAFGTLRRSEICGLSSDHVEGNVIKVRQVMVAGPDNKFIIKNYAKNLSSIRDISLPAFVVDMFPESGMLVTLNPSQVSHRHVKAIDRLGIKKFRFHDLRHYAASIMHALGVPDQYIMERGGWSSDKVLKNIYRGTIDQYSKQFEDVTLQHFEKMQHDIQHKNQ
ncbi:MAG: site-specific integrase [Clostridium sp.]|jgi:integrase|nr:site-specific integrase [Clostridium sp.]